MFRRAANDRQTSFDWLPWGLSVFGAGCAVFVLVAGVLPERSANRELMQEVARLQTDLARSSEVATASLEQAKAQLHEQDLATQARVSTAREEERARAALEAARRDLGQTLASEIEDGALALQEREGELAIVASERLIFYASSARLKPSGRVFLRELGKSIRRLPADQVYRVDADREARQRSVMRYLEYAAKVPGEQLVPGAAGQAAGGSGVIEIVLSRSR